MVKLPSEILAEMEAEKNGHAIAHAMLIDWVAFWLRDQTAEDWLIWPLVPAGRGTALYAPAKAGKSLVVLALSALAATGGRSLDGQDRPPVDVLYLDYEMTLDDLQERLEDMGYGPHSDLSHLHYASLPSLPPLDEPEGAKAVLELVQLTHAQVVVIDTMGRATDGDENEADTIRSFYRWTGLALKAMGVAFLRTDHAGKDIGKGQRGSSAKNDDVDIVFQLTRTEGGVVLKATHRRMAWVPETTTITVDDSEGWRFELAEGQQYPTGTKELADILDGLGVDEDASERVAFAAVRAAGHKSSNAKIRAALRWRRASLPLFVTPETSRGAVRGALIHSPVGRAAGRASDDPEETNDMQEEEGRGALRGAAGAPTPDKRGAARLYKTGAASQSPPSSEGDELEW